mmetsp:Transcript_21047/g.47711  ORF Transcript_21047/g.47711 Transcript_21047/m.47711 type:complete len:344 (-) Transcript_21047:324-1355(-)|eukprot:CAMPEP_0113318356 /NCGR_PEP_ID=MMETSP0010_2-20120614/12955_1 /TAXON_ID=216773 ORGANISM="Corethron hystrix, Strain 308" /NCGR_SAMPLE_ID=MMETSP0010_2 /ASSEMBLY_ACC=CAM_ASM_000155 /LENGTH=343 /DNA_ID=CAMNT_0000175637 /DNA_START=1 /DNA_END=1032 /DNA_ORIENTATION=- /assembly_acc=CAM_ASM_000155
MTDETPNGVRNGARLAASENPTIQVGKEKCCLFHDNFFSKLRSHFSVNDDFLSEFDFGKLRPSGGKGGDQLARTPDKRYFVKEISDLDRATITSEKFKTLYLKHLTGVADSYVVRFFALIQRGDLGKFFIVMSNCLPPEIGNDREWDVVYDCKGTKDDKVVVREGKGVEQVHKRFYKLSWMLGEGIGIACTPENRKIYREGKKDAFTDIHTMTAKSRQHVIDILRSDATLFEELNLMDYSVLLACVEIDLHEVDSVVKMPKSGDHFYAPIVTVHGQKAKVYYFGIIDFLQVWSSKKQVAHLIKVAFAPKPISTVPPKKYAKQFVEFFENRIQASDSATDFFEQ